MQDNIFNNACPRCGSPAMRSWDELTDDERFIFERISPHREPLEQRKKHRFCKRCHFEDRGERTDVA